MQGNVFSRMVLLVCSSPVTLCCGETTADSLLPCEKEDDEGSYGKVGNTTETGSC